MALPTRQLWEDFVFKTMNHLASSQKGGLFGTGAVRVDPNPIYSSHDTRYRVPLLNDLDTILGADDQRVQDGTLTATEIDGGQMFAPIIHRGDAIEQKYVERVSTGIDALTTYGPQIAARVLNQGQSRLLNVTNGAFGSGGPLATSHSYGDGSTILNTSEMAQAKATKLGENTEGLESLYVNSIVHADLVAQGVIDYKSAGTFGENVIISGLVPTLGGARVLINDRLCTRISHTVTVVAATDVITSSDNHGFSANQKVVFASDDTLPAGLTAGTTYYVIADGLTATDFKVSATSGGSAVDITDTGTGTHTVQGNQYYSYLIGQGAFYFGYQRSLNVKQYTEPLVKGEVYRTYWLFSISPTLWGISYTSATDNPDVADLETGSNWASALPDHQIKILRLYHNLSTDP